MRVDRAVGISTTLAAVAIIAAIVGASAFAYYEYSVTSKTTPLVVYTADLYTSESSYLYSGFANATGIPYSTPNGGGSTALATQIAQGTPVSVFITVAKSTIEQAALKSQYSGWGIAFAVDQMTLGYTAASGQPAALQEVLNAYQAAAASNTTSDWKAFFTDLTSGAVKVGISNPNSDPAGFRGWMVLEAAGQDYAGNSSYFTDMMLHNKGNYTASSAADLVAPLQSGQVQFLFMYRSGAVSDKLQSLVLPNQVNLGDPALAGLYSQLTYTTSSGVETGGPIFLFVTVPRTSVETAYALRFVVYIVQ
ncbi:MAG: substrate-binding domain-containing protein, partial [Nitrososphaerota archaeon]|nr:substrate-binding domain-containing protein [Nitrososphaerota archaeon]